MMMISVLCGNKSCQICSREEQEKKYSIRAACSRTKPRQREAVREKKTAPQLLSVPSTGCPKERCSSGMLLDDPRGISRPSDQPAHETRLQCGIVPQPMSLKAAVPNPSLQPELTTAALVILLPIAPSCLSTLCYNLLLLPVLIVPQAHTILGAQVLAGPPRGLRYSLQQPLGLFSLLHLFFQSQSSAAEHIRRLSLRKPQPLLSPLLSCSSTTELRVSGRCPFNKSCYLPVTAIRRKKKKKKMKRQPKLQLYSQV